MIELTSSHFLIYIDLFSWFNLVCNKQKLLSQEVEIYFRLFRLFPIRLNQEKKDLYKLESYTEINGTII